MILVDIDGCIFNNYHRAHLIPEDRTVTSNWTAFNQACAQDLPIAAVIEFVKHLSLTHDAPITFLTSRGEDSREATLHQLTLPFSGYDFDLHMRPMDEHRCTIEYKRDAIERLSIEFNDHSLIIDDHAGIINMCAADFPQLNRMLVLSFDCTVGD